MVSLRSRKKLTNDIEDKTFKELSDEYILYLQAEQRSSFTIKSHQHKIRRFSQWTGEDIKLSKITKTTMEKYKEYLSETKKNTSSSGTATDGTVTWSYVSALAVFKGYGTIQS